MFEHIVSFRVLSKGPVLDPNLSVIVYKIFDGELEAGPIEVVTQKAPELPGCAAATPLAAQQ